MALIPEPTVTQEDLAAWYEKAKQLAKLRAEEMVMRKRIFSHFFPNATEGTNKVEIGGGYELKVTYPIERKVDAALLTLMADKMREAGISVDKLIKLTPELAIKEYRTLTPEQTVIVDQILTIKPGSPTSMDISMPAKEKAKLEAATVAATKGVPFQ